MSLPTDGPLPDKLAQRPVADLANVLVRLRLVGPAQQQELLEKLTARFAEPRALARELIQRGWLTPYQVNQLFQDRGAQLLLGSYVILERLGEGGMGQVFKARHQHLDRVVALKVIRKDRLGKGDAVQRFRREIQAVAQLSHPNVVTAYDADCIGDTHFFAMEYVEGIDLGRLIKEKGPLAIDRAADYVRQAALGLQHAHERGLIHRDIKPSNLLRAQTHGPQPMDVVKVLDLGLARLARPGEEEITDTLTHEGTLMGTPDFIAPEQARNSHLIDARADLYSLGCTLYYLLAGRVPFPSDSVTEKLYKQWLEEPSPIEQLRPEVPAGLAGAVRRLMAKRPEDRFQTASALAAALLPGALARPPEAIWVSGSPTPLDHPVAVPMPVTAMPLLRKRSWVIAGGVGGVLFGLAVLGMILFSRSGRRSNPVAAMPVATMPTRVRQTREDFAWLTTRFGDRQTDEAKLRRDLLAFHLGHPDEPEGRKAAAMAAQLPSPLDALKNSSIPAAERWEGSPSQLLGVLGEHRWRHWKPARCAAFSPDGKTLASGGDDGVRLWNAATGRQQIALDTGPVLALAFVAEGENLAVAGADGKVTVWDVAAGRRLNTVAGPGNRVSRAAFAPAAGLMAWALDDGTVALWDRAAGKSKGRLKGHKGPVHCLAFREDGKALASGGADGLVKIWDVAAAAEVATLTGHEGTVFAIAFSPSGKMLASSGEDRAIHFWDLANQKETDAIDGLEAPATALRYVREGKDLASGDAEGRVALWNFKTHKGRNGPVGHTGAIRDLAYSATDDVLASVGADGLLRLVDLDNGEVKNKPIGHTSSVRALAFSADGRLLATGSADHTVKLWDVIASKGLATLKGHMGEVSSVAFSANGGRLASGSLEGRVRVWHLPKPEEPKPPEPEVLVVRRGRVLSVAWSLDNKTLAAASGVTEASAATGKPLELGGITLWDTGPPCRPRTDAQRHQGDALAVALAPGGKLGASGGRDGKVKLWDWQSVRDRATLPNDSPVLCVAFSPDGQSLAAGNGAGEIKLWNVTNNYQLARKEPLRGHAAPVSGVAFSPDGRSLVSVDLAGGVMVWDRSSGKRLQNWNLPGPAHGVAFAPDGRHIATANGNGTIYLFRLIPYKSRW